MVLVLQRTENSPHHGDRVNVFVGDSLLKTVLQGASPLDPNKRIDWFIAPGAKIRHLEEMLRHVRHYYNSINVAAEQLNIMIGVGYNDHQNYQGAMEDWDSFLSSANDLKLAWIPPPIPREKKLSLSITEYVLLAEAHKKLVNKLIEYNRERGAKTDCEVFRTSVKTRSKTHFASDSYHFSYEKTNHIINHVRQVFSQNRVFDM